MEEALLALIAGDAGVKKLVANKAIAWGQRLNLPAVVLHLISGPRPDMTMGGPSGLEVSLVQVDCWAAKFGDAVEIGRAVRNLVSGYRAGSLRIFVEGGGSDFEMGDGVTDAGQPGNFHRIRLDLRVWHRNP